jgi:hypothetical protein
MHMAPIRHLGRALIIAGALSIPALASAEQAPTALCDGDKMEEKEPTAEKSEATRDADKASKKIDDKSEQKRDPRQSGKTS